MRPEDLDSRKQDFDILTIEDPSQQYSVRQYGKKEETKKDIPTGMNKNSLLTYDDFYEENPAE